MKIMKQQILVIHGGHSFDFYEKFFEFLKNYEINFEKLKTKDWKDTLGEKLGADFEVIFPKMPNAMNAKYSEYKIYFEKLIPFLENEVVLIGHSLGGIFLAKYLSENDFPKRILATFLVAASFDAKSAEYSLGDFTLSGGLEKFQKQNERIFLCHSKDDDVVPFSDFEKYQKELPKAEAMVFEDRKHFNQPEFPEIIEAIKKL